MEAQKGENNHRKVVFKQVLYCCQIKKNIEPPSFDNVKTLRSKCMPGDSRVVEQAAKDIKGLFISKNEPSKSRKPEIFLVND